jgi:predicted  nucleic acid-binding Zn-ribbon protein
MILEYYGIRGLQYLTVKNGVYDFMDTNDDEFEFKYEGNQWRLYKGGILTTPGNVYEDGEDEYEDERTDRIVEINDEIDDIKNNPDGDLDDDEVESEVSDRMDEVRSDPMRWINDYEINVDNFIDRRSFVMSLVSDSDYSSIGGYNDSYDEIYINGTNYVVIRTS